MLRGLVILLVLQLFGEWLSESLQIAVPGNVIGMGLLLLALLLGWLRLAWVEDAAELLLTHFSLFFIPAGVGVMVHTEVIARQWQPILLATVLSTFVVLGVTAKVGQWLEGDEEGVPDDL
ncbi:MAG: CidA/LrgA family protein [Desulfuromonas sp.]|nr:MAG: CidA/LrgA family protein [Desulfuromonas sp.]